MKKRNLKVRALTGCMAVVLFMTSFAPLTVQAEELPIEEVITVEETVVVEETTEEAQTEEPTVVEETTEEAKVEESTVVEEVTEEAQAEESTVVEEVTEEAQVEEPTVVEETTEEHQVEDIVVAEQPEESMPEETEPEEEIDIEAIEAEAEANVKARLENMTVEELMDYCLNLSTATPDNYKCEDAKNTDADHVRLVQEAERKYADKLLKAYLNNGLDALIGTFPNGKIYGKPIQNVIYTILGINNDSVDLKEVINSTHSETMKKLDEVCKKNKEISVNAATLCDYGSRFDAFEIEAKQRAEAISKIKKNPDISDKEKAVRMAAVIGGTKDWDAGKTALFEKMAYAAQTLRGKPATDAYGRNLFEALYDFNKDDSAFSGEAMDKSEGYIQERLNGFLRNCGVAIECLKAHQTISAFTEEDLAEMDPDIRKTYDEIKSSSYDIKSKLKSIISIFTGDKEAEDKELQTGILETAGKYYSKSRRNYLDHQGATVKEVAISKNLYVQKSESFKKDDLKAHSALTREQIIELQAHVNSTGMTMAEYLEAMGIDVASAQVRKGPHGYRTMYLSTLDSKVSSTANSRGKGTTDWYLKGINMKQKGATETTYKYCHQYIPTFAWEDEEHNRYNSAVSIVLQFDR